MTLWDRVLYRCGMNPLRHFRTDPVGSVLAMVALALGIAANTVIFSVVNALLLRPLPVASPDRLYRVGVAHEGAGFGPVSHPELQELNGPVPAFTGALGHNANSVVLEAAGVPEQAQMELVTGNYFDVLGIQPAPGRGFNAEEDRTPGTHAVVIVSHGLWQTRLGGNPDVIGRPVRINGVRFEVVGVAPRGFGGTLAGMRIDVWVPVMMQGVALPRSGSLENRGDRFLMAIARLREGTSVAEARSQLAVVSARWSTERRAANESLVLMEATGTHPFLAGLIRTFLALLMGMVAVVLFIACANVANLMLARVFERGREIAVRAALGAGRWRIARVFLVESMHLALPGGVLGLLLAWWSTRLLSAFRPDIGIPVELGLRMDVRVLLFALGVTMATTLFFGLVPALRAAGTAPFAVLRESGATSSTGRARVRSMLVVAQVALSALLLFGAGLLLRSLSSTRGFDPGFDVTGMHVLSGSPELLGYDEERTRALWRELVDRAGGVAGVASASLALFVPMGDRGDQMIAVPAEAPWPVDAGRPPLVPYNIIEPGYFRTMGITLRGGRDVSEADVSASEPVAIVSATAAARWWPGEEAVGRRLRVVDRGGNESMRIVIGVAGDVALGSPAAGPEPLLYLPFAQLFRPDMMLHVRSDGRPGIAADLLAEMRALEPGLPVRLRTMAEATAFRLIPLRIAGSVLGGAGAIGLFLAATGVFGIIAWTVSRQSREIAIRLALGADRWRVRGMVITRAVRLTAVGLAIGIAAAVVAARLIRGLLYGVSTADPATLAGVALLFLVVTMVAAWVPARRASRADPAAVLREE